MLCVHMSTEFSAASTSTLIVNTSFYRISENKSNDFVTAESILPPLLPFRVNFPLYLVNRISTGTELRFIGQPPKSDSSTP